MFSISPKMADPGALRPHHLTHLIPPMRAGEWDEFLADIKAHGIRVPLELLPDGITVVDGRHRLRAALELDMKMVPVVDAPLNGDSPEVHTLKAAVLRRHLSDEQRATLAALWKEQRRKATAGPGRGHTGEKTPEPRGSEVLDAGHPSRNEARQLFMVSQKKVDRASKLLHAAPDHLERVHRGEMKLNAAWREVENEETRGRLATLPSTTSSQPSISLASYPQWLATQPDCDLLITDPPYSTETEDSEAFARGWLPLALAKVKPIQGRVVEHHSRERLLPAQMAKTRL